ncbi:paladin isoform X5 [Corythoichthys intestinalis]|nr:paladin isoform X5 [Corythoichthys intestinalis]XP_057682603.1 paladin isoform X5 [Corythoichthys intestinalis]XP_057682604.1 paladin isoform X5 [Corythoichthys intestinalis]XP_057682605.1 paladin isoform X5 [Corythoichthys intestinalis]XP_057682606.1 paladin isoform X5 [Corythoichthys intestinalis]XP_057682607.1 paladin isoform X5 [Corythoichthys intestinalis]XP_057682608.1 paladin isoform X5 [Corythoichthys intestinalis]XP_061807928.1 paladin-like isoform X3 [Nerophis lumbriciformis]
MGTTASAAPPPLESVHGNGMADSRPSLSMSPFHTVNVHNNKAKSIITNKVAPVVITYNCKQEFQIHDDIRKSNYKVGRISDAMPEHYMVQGEYFMVQDVYSKADVLSTTNSVGAPNFRQVKGSYPLFGMGQPSMNGFKRVLQKLQAQGHEEVIFICVREEPVVFLHKGDDFVPYTPRRKENLHENLHGLEKEGPVEALELTVRKELHDFAKLSENVYYVYNDIEYLKDEPQKMVITCEEDIHVTEEVYKRPVFTLPAYSYYRLPLPVEGAPMEEDFDAFVNILREIPSLSLRRNTRPKPPALLFSCQVGVGRTNLAMILGALAINRLRGDSGTPPPLRSEEATEAPTEPKPVFRIIQSLIAKLPNGQQIMEEVDRAIALCSEMHNIKEAIYENKSKLEGIGDDYQIQGNSTKNYFLNRTRQSLERYFYLIVFNAYLHEQYPLAFVSNFTQWMCRHTWLYRLLARMDLSELSAPPELVTRGARVLVASEYLAPDVLSTAKEMKAVNFRRVPKMPIYGMAQPTSEATGAVLAHLTDEKRKHSHILWINLQEELVLEANGQIFSPREPSHLDQHIAIPTSDPLVIEKLETSLKEEIVRAQKWLEVTLEQEKQMKMFKSILTAQEIFAQHKKLTPALSYKRVPLPDCSAPREEDFDKLLDAMKSSLAEDSSAAFVFNCSDGKGRTTTAMVLSVLTLWHFNGFPEFTEDEIVSVPDAKYTKGEFQVVMQLVRLLPDGHRMKREVDMALDSVSETMTPMHYHLREIIICTYRQIKSGKSERECHQLLLKSLQYLERYIYLILFNTYLHLEKKDSWQRSFTLWMEQVASKAGVYDILNRLSFCEFKTPRDAAPPARLRWRWQQQNSLSELPFRGHFL